MQYFQTPTNFNKVLWRRHTIIVPPYADPESRDTPAINESSRSESVNTNVPPLYSESILSPTSETRGVTRENRYNSQPTRQPESSGDGGAESNLVSKDLGNAARANSAYQMKNNSTENENVNSELPGVNERQKQKRSKRTKSRSMISTDLPPLRDVGASVNISSLGNDRRAILPPIQAPESKRSSVDIFAVTK